MTAYRLACEALLMAVGKAADPVVYAKYGAWAIPYYGHPEDNAVWWAKYVYREAQRLGLLPLPGESEAA